MIKKRDVLKAASKIGTPFYFYDADVIRRRYRSLRSALGERWSVYYAVKANPNVEILKIYRALGARAECASAGELLACAKAGFKPLETALSGPVKAAQETKLIEKKRPSVIHSETLTELQTLNRIGEKFDVALRINVDRAVPGEKGGRVMTGGMDKFGFTADDARKIILGRGKYNNLNFVGFHFYLGTQMLSPKTWLKGAESYARCVAKICKEAGFSAKYLNFGGGLGIPYLTGERELSLDALEKGVKKLERFISGVDELSGAKLYMEPGRYLIGSAGVYVTRVVAVKNIRGTDFALTDGGIHHALFPFRVSREFPAFRVDGKAGRPRRYVLGGPLCTTLDQSDLPLSLPELKEGSLIAVGNSGAYGYATGMHFFLSHPLPAEVLLDGGEFYMIREPSVSEHLFRLQTRRKL